MAESILNLITKWQQHYSIHATSPSILKLNRIFNLVMCSAAWHWTQEPVLYAILVVLPPIILTFTTLTELRVRSFYRTNKIYVKSIPSMTIALELQFELKMITIRYIALINGCYATQKLSSMMRKAGPF